MPSSTATASATMKTATASTPNAIVAMLPPSAADSSYASPAEFFGQFGEIAYIEMLSMPLPTFSVIYFDSRSAAKAFETLGDVFCEFGAQCGSCVVRLSGDMNLAEADLGNISNITDELAESGAFVVEFFDVRDAARLQELATKAMRAVHAQVFVSGLPNAVCNEVSMEAVLEQAGLEDSVLEFTTKRGSLCGELNVTLRGEDASRKCVSHFNGRQWDASGALVFASVLSMQAAPKANEHQVQKVPMTAPPGLLPPPGFEDYGTDLSSALALAFDVDIIDIAAKKMWTITENESSTDAGTSDADGDQDEEFFAEQQIAVACQ